jgi:5-methyltetrahydrofolate--homocysteine methyltransferase
MTRTIVASATREVVIGFRPALLRDRRTHQPDRPQEAGRRNGRGQFRDRDQGRAGPGRRRRHHARRQCRRDRGQPERDRAGAARQDTGDRPGLVDVPLSIDSSVTAAIEAALKVAKGRPLVNSVTGERKSSKPSCRCARNTTCRSSRSPTTRPASPKTRTCASPSPRRSSSARRLRHQAA